VTLLISDRYYIILQHLMAVFFYCKILYVFATYNLALVFSRHQCPLNICGDYVAVREITFKLQQSKCTFCPKK